MVRPLAIDSMVLMGFDERWRDGQRPLPRQLMPRAWLSVLEFEMALTGWSRSLRLRIRRRPERLRGEMDRDRNMMLVCRMRLHQRLQTRKK